MSLEKINLLIYTVIILLLYFLLHSIQKDTTLMMCILINTVSYVFSVSETNIMISVEGWHNRLHVEFA